MDIEEMWQYIILRLSVEGIETTTIPSNGRKPLWFFAYADGEKIGITNAKYRQPSTKITGQRLISKKDFSIVASYYQRWASGERYLRKEVRLKSRNTAYIFALISECENWNKGYNIDVFKLLYPRLKEFVYHYLSYKAIHGGIDNLPGDTEFWAFTCNAHLQMASIKWCMVFGSYKNKIHWTHLGFGKDSFFDFLFKQTNISMQEWEKSWTKMLDFRNNYVAHLDEEYNRPTPYFNVAYQGVLYFELWLREKIRPDYIDSEPLVSLYQTLNNNINNTLDLLKS